MSQEIIINNYYTVGVTEVNGVTPDINGVITILIQNILTQDQIDVLNNTSGINTGDQDLSGYQLISQKNQAGGYLGITAGNVVSLPLGMGLLSLNITPDQMMYIDGSGNILSLNAVNSRAKLGLGTLATQNGTFSDKVDKATFPYHDSFVCSDLTTAITAVVFDYKMMAKFAFTATSFVIDMQTAQTSGSIITFDILKNGVTVLSTLATIDNTEKSTLTATTTMVINGGQVSFNAGDILSVQCIQVGDGTAKCVTATVIGNRSI